MENGRADECRGVENPSWFIDWLRVNFWRWATHLWPALGRCNSLGEAPVLLWLALWQKNAFPTPAWHLAGFAWRGRSRTVSPASALKNPVPFHSVLLRLERCEVIRRIQRRDSLYSPSHSKANSSKSAATLAKSSPFIGSRLDIRRVSSSNPRHNAAQSPCSLAVPQTKPWPLRANGGAKSGPFCRRPRPVGLGLLHHGDPTLLVHP